MISSITVRGIFALQLILFVLANDSYMQRDDQIAGILRKLSELEKEVSMLKRNLEACTKMDRKCSAVDAQIRGRRIGEQSQVAFHAQLSHNLNNLGLLQAIHFDQVLLNEGGGYSVHAGEFVAPVSGLYVFSWTISAGDRTCVKYHVVKNSVILTYFISDAHEHDDWAVSSGTVVTRMDWGDRVWIRIGNMITCSQTVFDSLQRVFQACSICYAEYHHKACGGDISVKTVGLIISLRFPFLRASVDGASVDGIVDILNNLMNFFIMTLSNTRGALVCIIILCYVI